MSDRKHIRRLACVAAVGLVSLGVASPARADLAVTIEDVDTFTSVTFTDDASGATTSGGLTSTALPGNLTITGNFGNFTGVSLTVKSNYNSPTASGPSSGSSSGLPLPPAQVTETSVSAVGAMSDTLIVSVASGNWTIPSSYYVLLTNGVTSSAMTSATDSATFGSTLNALPSGSPTSTTNASITGPIPDIGTLPPTTSKSDGSSAIAANPGGLFSLANTLTLVYGTAHDSMTVTGTTSVFGTTLPSPEPSTMGLALSGGLLMLAGGWVRRRRPH